MMAAWKLAPALAAGNTVVLKPSEQTPLTTLKLAEHLAEIFPTGVVNVVLGRGETVGAPLVAHPGVRMISLTGDVATGRKVLQAAAATLKRTHLELGGKAPVIVFDDADLEAVVQGVRDVRLLQRRPGLHRRLPDLCRARRSTTSWSPTWQRRSRRSDMATPPAQDMEIGPLISAGAARARRGLRRARRRRAPHRGRDRRQARRRRAASSTSRR